MYTPETIRKLRFDLDMTQEEFGALVGAQQATVSRWENGVTNVMKPYRVLLDRVIRPLAEEKARERAEIRER